MGAIEPHDLLKLNAEVKAGVSVEEAAASLGLVSPDDPLRERAAATDLSERGVPVRYIMLQGGWKSMSALRPYLREDKEALREHLREGLDL